VADASSKFGSSGEPCGMFFSNIADIRHRPSVIFLFFKLLLKERKKSYILGAIFLCIKHQNFRSYAGETFTVLTLTDLRPELQYKNERQ